MHEDAALKPSMEPQHLNSLEQHARGSKTSLNCSPVSVQSGSHTRSAVIGLRLHKSVTALTSKPLFLAETTSVPGSGNKAAYITDKSWST